jgi:hypothetical protein
MHASSALKIEQHDVGANAPRFHRSFGSVESDKRVVTQSVATVGFASGLSPTKPHGLRART